MKNFNNDIDNLISKILKEEIEIKSKQMSEEIGEWVEIETNEELHGDQDKLDVAEPFGKITADDFDKLRKKGEKDQELDEFFFDDEDDENIEDAEELSQNEPTYVGKGLEDNKMKADMANK